CERHAKTETPPGHAAPGEPDTRGQRKEQGEHDSDETGESAAGDDMPEGRGEKRECRRYCAAHEARNSRSHVLNSFRCLIVTPASRLCAKATLEAAEFAFRPHDYHYIRRVPAAPVGRAARHHGWSRGSRTGFRGGSARRVGDA